MNKKHEIDGFKIIDIDGIPYVHIFSNRKNGKPCKTYHFLKKLSEYKKQN